MPIPADGCVTHPALIIEAHSLAPAVGSRGVHITQGEPFGGFPWDWYVNEGRKPPSYWANSWMLWAQCIEPSDEAYFPLNVGAKQGNRWERNLESLMATQSWFWLLCLGSCHSSFSPESAATPYSSIRATKFLNCASWFGEFCLNQWESECILREY